MIEHLRRNIDTEIEILKEIAQYSALAETATPSEQKLLQTSIASLAASLKLINNSVPALVNSISLAKQLPGQPSGTALELVHFKGVDADVIVALRPDDKAQLFRELSVSETALKKIKKTVAYQVPEKSTMFEGSRGYVKLANRFFMSLSERIVQKGYMKQLAVDIRKANYEILFESYISSMLLTSLISAFVGLLLLLFLTFFDMHLEFPVLTVGLSPAADFLRFLWLPLLLPAATFCFLWWYPSSEKTSIARRIEQELPFAVIHMSAISGSGIEPTSIFRIIAFSKEYPYLRKEIRKLLNQMNLYGYDVVTALTTVAKNTPSIKLAELFTGLATTMNSGGDLPVFFEKRAETLLVSYRLEREKFTRVAETFMDIYITIAVAAPMILMLILVMLSLSEFDVGLSPTGVTLLVIAALAILNVFFLTILNVKQPAY